MTALFRRGFYFMADFMLNCWLYLGVDLRISIGFVIWCTFGK